MLQWHAIYVSANREKKLAAHFEQRGIEVYCPCQTEVRQWSDRKKKVSVPLFRSYLFLRIDHQRDQLQVLQTPGVVAFVKWLRQIAVIRDEEIKAIRDFLSNHEEVKLHSLENLKRGDELSVQRGPMMGKTGKVLDSSRHKVKLLLEQLGMEMIAEIPKSQLSKSA